MEPIRAFVGYSFSVDDEEVVRTILKCLTRIGELHPNFSWQSAKEPEPRMVDEKVLTLFADKNLFIGICTAKERVVANEVLKAPWWAPHWLGTRKTNYLWKTSDWIIQEIGLALGKDIDVILLVEDNTRVPGEVQGNLEYVAFSRNAPEKCFDALLGMVARLGPKVLSAQGTVKPATVESSADTDNVSDNEYSDPTSDWTKRDYSMALFGAVATSNDDRIRMLTESFHASTVGASVLERERWAAYLQYCRLVVGEDGRLSEIKTIADNNPADPEIWTYLAKSYLRYDEFASASVAFHRAANSTSNERQRIKLLGDASLASFRNNDKLDANRILEEIRNLGPIAIANESMVLTAEKELAEASGQSDVYIGSIERLVELDPGDVSHRFSLAFKYGDMGLDALAAFHYSKIPVQDRDENTWNNLGVALSRLGLPILTVDAYRAAESKGETLAMSNLAYKLLEAGFLSEALEILQRAIVIPDHHKNIEHAMVQAKDLPDSEQEKEKELFDGARKTSDFYRQFGRALVRTLDADIGGPWKAPNVLIAITIEGSRLSAMGTYELSGLGTLAYALAPTIGAAEPNVRMRVEYSGRIRGRTVIGTVNRSKEGEIKTAASLLGNSEPDSLRVLMLLEDDNNSIRVLEQSGSSAPRFYYIKR
jgi:tetratricopeptide (TPR) repeat protein